jgi:ankyrin repeat protein
MDMGGRTPLHSAAITGSVDPVKILVEREGSLAMTDETGMAPLHHAVYGVHMPVIEILLAACAPVNQTVVKFGDESLRAGWTPLHLASIRGSLKATQLLFAYEADVTARDECCQTPLHCAASRGSKEVVEVLLARGADVHASDESLWTPLHHAAEHGAVPAARLLLKAKAEVFSANRRNRTPLHLATDEGNLEMCALLVQHGSAYDDVGVAYGQPTPKMIATKNDFKRGMTLFSMADLLAR